MRRLSMLAFFLAAFALFGFLFHKNRARESRVAIATPAERTLTIAQSVDMESMEPDNLNSASSVNIADSLWGKLLKVTPEGRVTGIGAESGIPIPAICPSRQLAVSTSNAKIANVRFMSKKPGLIN